MSEDAEQSTRSDGRVERGRDIPPTRRHEAPAGPTAGALQPVPVGIPERFMGGFVAIFAGVLLTAMTSWSAADGTSVYVLAYGPIALGLGLLVRAWLRGEPTPAPAAPPAADGDAPAAEPLAYPDGRVSRALRAVDIIVGQVEKVVLVALLLDLMVVAGLDALADKLADDHLDYKEAIVRGATFAIAMLGTAYATQQSRSLAMDLVSRRLAPRARLFLKVVLELFTIFIVAIVVRAGLHNLDRQAEGFFEKVAWLIPIGGGLVILHCLLHVAIDVDYLARRQTPPERMRSGH